MRREAGIFRLFFLDDADMADVGVVDDEGNDSCTLRRFEDFGPLSVLSFLPRGFGVTGDEERLLLFVFFAFELRLDFCFSISFALRRAATS